MVGDEVIDLRRGVQLILDVGLLDLSSKRPGGTIERCISPDWRPSLEPRNHADHVDLAVVWPIQ